MITSNAVHTEILFGLALFFVCYDSQHVGTLGTVWDKSTRALGTQERWGLNLLYFISLKTSFRWKIFSHANECEVYTLRMRKNRFMARCTLIKIGPSAGQSLFIFKIKIPWKLYDSLLNGHVVNKSTHCNIVVNKSEGKSAYMTQKNI